MKKLAPPYRLLAIVGLVFSALTVKSQSADNPFLQHLPPNATNIIRVNLPQIGSKIDLPALLAHLPMKTAIGQALKDPASVGIDLHQDMYFTETSTAPDSPAYTCFIVHLADSGKLAAYIRTSYPKARFFRAPGKNPTAGEHWNNPDSNKNALWSEEGIGFAWNHELAVLTVMRISPNITALYLPHNATPNSATPKNTTPKSATTPHHQPPPSPDRSAWFVRKAIGQSQAILQGYHNSFFTTNQEFIASFSSDADLTTWGTQGNNFMMMAKMMAHHMPGSNAMTKMAAKRHLNTITDLRFENGRLLINSATRLPPDTTALIARLTSRPFNEGLAARLPQGNLIGMASMHIDPTAILPLIKKIQPALDSMFNKKGPNIYRFMNAFKGDFLIAAIAPQGDTAVHKKVNFYFVSTINDLSAFLDLAHQMHLVKDSTAANSPDTSHSPLAKLQTAYTIHDSICVVSSNRTLTDAYFNTTPHKVDLVSDDFRNNFFTLVIDIKALQAFLQSLPAGNDGKSGKAQQMQALLGQFNRLTVTAGMGKGNEITSSMEIQLSDPSVNSLKLLSGLLVH